jgi:hypothetical protein
LDYQSCALRVLIIVLLITLLLVFLHRRLRPYLKLLQNVVSAIRSFRQMGVNPDGGRFTRRNDKATEKLVRCAACGTWVPVGRALAGGRADAVFCSSQCLRDGGTERRRASGGGA